MGKKKKKQPPQQSQQQSQQPQESQESQQPHERQSRRTRVSDRSSSCSGHSSRSSCSSCSSCSSDSCDYDDVFPYQLNQDINYYTETIESIDPSREDTCNWLYIQTPLEYNEMKTRLDNVMKDLEQVTKVLFTLIKKDKTDKHHIIMKLDNHIHERDITNARIEFRNTYSYVYFPENRFNLMIDYLVGISDDATFETHGDCDFDIESIISIRKDVGNLIETNDKFGYDTPQRVIDDYLAYRFIMKHCDIQKFPDKKTYLNTLIQMGFLELFGSKGLRYASKLFKCLV